MTREDLRNEWNELNEQDSFVNKEMTPYAHWLEKKFLEREQQQALDMHSVSGSTETYLVDPNNCPHRSSGFCTA